jgi:hypothetical protein
MLARNTKALAEEPAAAILDRLQSIRFPRITRKSICFVALT